MRQPLASLSDRAPFCPTHPVDDSDEEFEDEDDGSGLTTAQVRWGREGNRGSSASGWWSGVFVSGAVWFCVPIASHSPPRHAPLHTPGWWSVGTGAWVRDRGREAHTHKGSSSEGRAVPPRLHPLTHPPTPPTPHTQPQVQQLLSVMCDETDVAELEVRLGSFELRVVRSTDGLPDAPDAARASGGIQTAPGAPTIPTPAPGTAFASTASMDGASPLPTASLDATASLDDESEDEAATTLLVGSPKVGILRRGKYVKGKRVGKGNVVDAGAEIKKGQVLAFVEQLGTFAPVEAPQAGELLDFLVEDGDPVEFRQPVVEFAPFFGGHIIGDSKHA